MRYFGLPAKCVLVALSATALAETHFCMGGDLETLSATQMAECRTKMVEMREAVKRHGAPSGWHFVVVCDENGWKDYASFAGQERAKTINASYSTDAEMHSTFVRGSRMDANSPEEADLVLASAMKSVPARRLAPIPLASPKRTSSQLDVQVAEVNLPDNDETYGGQ